MSGVIPNSNDHRNRRGAAGTRMLIVGVIVVVGAVLAIRLASMRSDEPRSTKPTTKTVMATGDSDESRTTKRSTRIGTISGNSGQNAEKAGAGSKASSTAQAGNRPKNNGNRPQLSEDERNLLEQRQQLSELVARFQQEQDPEKRSELADELSDNEAPQAIDEILALLREEKDLDVRISLLEALESSDALDSGDSKAKVLGAIQDFYKKIDDVDERRSIQDVAGELETKPAVKFLWDAYQDQKVDPAEKVNAAENTLRLRAKDQTLVDDTIVNKMTQDLKLEIQATPDPALRSQAIMALAANKTDDTIKFFREQAEKEQDPNVRHLLRRLSGLE